MTLMSNNFTKLSEEHLSPLSDDKKSDKVFSKFVEKAKQKLKTLTPQDYVNVFLIVTIFAFIMSLTRAIGSSQQTSSSQASEVKNGAIAGGKKTTTNFDVVTIAEDTTPLVPHFPNKYKDEVIDARLYADGYITYAKMENLAKKKLISDTVVKYYIYKDVLSIGEFEEVNAEITNFGELEKKVHEFQELIKDNLVSYADFAYFKVQFVQNNKEGDQEVEKKLGGPQKDIARKIITRYKKKFEENIGAPDKVFDEADSDKEVLILNNGILTKNLRYHEKLSKGSYFFIADPAFNDFLFKQKEGTVSEPYEFKAKEGSNDTHGFIIVIPSKIFQGPYDSINAIIEDRKKFFEYPEQNV